MTSNLSVVSPDILTRPVNTAGSVYAMLVNGKPRMGKFFGVRSILTQWADDRRGAMVLELPVANENGPLSAQDMHANGHGRRTFLDSLGSTTHCLPAISFPKDTSADPFIRTTRNIDNRDGLIELLGRNRLVPIEQQTTVIELTSHAIDLCMEAEIAVKYDHLLAVGKDRHPLFYELMDNCPIGELVHYWNTIPKHGVAVRNDLASFWRLTEQKLGDPRILTRQTDERRLADMLRKQQIIIVEGCKSRRATKTYLGLLGMSVKQTIHDHFTETGDPLNVLEVSDEVQSHDLFTVYESHAIREMPKMGLNSIVIAHGPRLLADPIENADALQNFDAFQFYGCGDWDTALQCARLAVGVALDPYLEHSRETRTVQRRKGSYAEPTRTVTRTKGKSGDKKTESESEARGERIVQEYEDASYDIIKNVELDNQFTIAASRLMQLPPRERLARRLGEVRWETVPLMEEPWIIPELGAAKMANFLKAMHQRSEFRTPSIGEPVVRLSLPSSTSTRQLSDNSSNGHKEPESKKSFSTATQALLAVLHLSGKKRPAP